MPWPQSHRSRSRRDPLARARRLVVDDDELDHVRGHDRDGARERDGWNTVCIGEWTLTAEESALAQQLRGTAPSSFICF